MKITCKYELGYDRVESCRDHPCLAGCGWCWFAVRQKYCWLAGGWCWFDVREKHCCWLPAEQSVPWQKLSPLHGARPSWLDAWVLPLTRDFLTRSTYQWLHWSLFPALICLSLASARMHHRTSGRRGFSSTTRRLRVVPRPPSCSPASLIYNYSYISWYTNWDASGYPLVFLGLSF